MVNLRALSQSETPDAPVSQLQPVIAAWLDYAEGVSQSARTRASYTSTLASACAALRFQRLDVDSADEARIRAALEQWAARPRTRDGQPASAATFNQRLAVVSSFYRFAQGRELRRADGEPIGNPAAPVRIRRKRTQAYRGAHAIAPGDIAARLAAIDRSSLVGKRDYALLSLALSTGRRIAELLGLTWRDALRAGDGVLTLDFRRCKGNKRLSNELAPPVAASLLAWLSAQYGELDTLAPDAPLWPSLSRSRRAYGWQPITPQAAARIWEQRLGVTKAHVSRHSFARAMLEAGARIDEIQAALGHSSVAVTARYIEALQSARNRHAGEVARLFGMAE